MIHTVRIQEPTLRALLSAVDEHQEPTKGGRYEIESEYSPHNIFYENSWNGGMREINASLSYIDTKTAELFFDGMPIKCVYVRSGGLTGEFKITNLHRWYPRASENFENQKERIQRISDAIIAKNLEGLSYDTMVSWQGIIANERAMLYYSNSQENWRQGTHRLQSDHRWQSRYWLSIENPSEENNDFERVEKVLERQGCSFASTTWISPSRNIKYLFEETYDTSFR